MSTMTVDQTPEGSVPQLRSGVPALLAMMTSDPGDRCKRTRRAEREDPVPFTSKRNDEPGAGLTSIWRRNRGSEAENANPAVAKSPDVALPCSKRALP